MANIINPYDSPGLHIPQLPDEADIDPRFLESMKVRILRVVIKVVYRFKKIDLKIFNAILKHSDKATREEHLHVIRALAKIIDAKDPYTRGHCDKVMKYALRICKAMNLPGYYINSIKTASQLHDIGKISVDVTILRKTMPLTKDDWQKIRMHPDVGAKIVHQMGFLDDIVPIIKHHHERYDGGGYPDGSLNNIKIPLGARIIAVADAYDAMTSDRPYRKAMKKEDAVAELKRCAGGQFDPEVVEAFIR